MTTKLQPVRGTHDLLPGEMRKHRKIIDTARKTALLFGYEEMATPIFEMTEVFKRTLGDTSDIVTKEMYSFQDRGGDSLTLRPEGTAGVARALISGGLQQHLPLKYFYSGPMFRYERPQKGRLRQFHQTGLELLGIADPGGDSESIAVGVEFLRRLGIFDRCLLEINSLGDQESRDSYRVKLVSYLEARKAHLSKESLERLTRNPLRILDSKDEGDQALLKDAPLNSDSWTTNARDFFLRVQDNLASQDIPWIINPKLVRGLDYYSHTCFEITCQELGAQKTVLAGGRYDGLIPMMGGPAVAGVGWGSGIDRLALLLEEEPLKAILAIIPADEKAEKEALQLAMQLRRENIAIDLGFSGNMGKRLKRADKIGALFALILGESERQAGRITLRDMKSGAQILLSPDELAGYLKAHLPSC